MDSVKFMQKSGFRPGSRPIFALAKIGKTIASTSVILDGTAAQKQSGPTHFAQTRPAEYQERRPKKRTAGVGEQSGEEVNDKQTLEIN